MAIATVPALATSRTRRISSVAYATEDNASEEKTGRARIFGSKVCSSRSLATARPTRTRFSTPLPEPGGGTSGGRHAGFYVDSSATQRYPTPGSVRISAGADASSPASSAAPGYTCGDTWSPSIIPAPRPYLQQLLCMSSASRGWSRAPRAASITLGRRQMRDLPRRRG